MKKTFMTNRYIILCLLIYLIFAACDDGVKTSEEAQLSVTPSSLQIPLPPAGNDYSEASLEIKNIGGADLTLVKSH